jgi:hypothetical protein
MRLILEDRKKQYRTIYEALNENPRIKVKRLTSILYTNHVTVRRGLREALEKGYVLLPQIRKQSYLNLREYMYFIWCSNPFKFFKQYSEDMNIVYHAVMSGFANLWIIKILRTLRTLQ